MFLVFVRPSSIAPSLVLGLGDYGGTLLGLGEHGGALLGLGGYGGALLGLGEHGGAVLGLSEHGGALLGLGNPLGPVPLRDHVELVLLGDLVELGLREGKWLNSSIGSKLVCRNYFNDFSVGVSPSCSISTSVLDQGLVSHPRNLQRESQL